MDLAEPQAVCLQARFLPEGVAQGTDEPRGKFYHLALLSLIRIAYNICLLHSDIRTTIPSVRPKSVQRISGRAIPQSESTNSSVDWLCCKLTHVYLDYRPLKS